MEVESDVQKINEEYKVWKKNTPFLYDLVLTHALEWPSLTVQWLPTVQRFNNQDYNEHKIILGTHTAGDEQNYLMHTTVKLPHEDTEIDARKYDDERGELGGYGGVTGKIDVVVRIPHENEVNRAKYMPQDPFVVATKTISGEVHVFDVTKHASVPTNDAKSSPNVRCVGHKKEGYGIDWSPHSRGHLLSGGDDGLICRWDINSAKDGEPLEAIAVLNAHEGSVEDVQWHRHHRDMFGSVGDDSLFSVWDIRSSATSPTFSVKAHDSEANTMCFSPFSEFLVVTGGADKVIKLWDMRNMSRCLHSFESHTDEVLKVEWSPFHESVIASCSADRRVMVWDMSRIGQEQSEEDKEDGPPELLFIHGGHTAKVTDFSWNTQEEWVIASVAEDNILQVWQMAENIYMEDSDNAPGPLDEDLE